MPTDDLENLCETFDNYNKGFCDALRVGTVTKCDADSSVPVCKLCSEDKASYINDLYKEFKADDVAFFAYKFGDTNTIHFNIGIDYDKCPEWVGTAPYGILVSKDNECLSLGLGAGTDVEYYTGQIKEKLAAYIELTDTPGKLTTGQAFVQNKLEKLNIAKYKWVRGGTVILENDSNNRNHQTFPAFLDPLLSFLPTEELVTQDVTVEIESDTSCIMNMSESVLFFSYYDTVKNKKRYLAQAWFGKVKRDVIVISYHYGVELTHSVSVIASLHTLESKIKTVRNEDEFEYAKYGDSFSWDYVYESNVKDDVKGWLEDLLHAFSLGSPGLNPPDGSTPTYGGLTLPPAPWFILNAFGTLAYHKDFWQTLTKIADTFWYYQNGGEDSKLDEDDQYDPDNNQECFVTCGMCTVDMCPDLPIEQPNGKQPDKYIGLLALKKAATAYQLCFVLVTYNEFIEGDCEKQEGTCCSAFPSNCLPPFGCECDDITDGVCGEDDYKDYTGYDCSNAAKSIVVSEVENVGCIDFTTICDNLVSYTWGDSRDGSPNSRIIGDINTFYVSGYSGLPSEVRQKLEEKGYILNPTQPPTQYVNGSFYVPGEGWLKEDGSYTQNPDEEGVIKESVPDIVEPTEEEKEGNGGGGGQPTGPHPGSNRGNVKRDLRKILDDFRKQEINCEPTDCVFGTRYDSDWITSSSFTKRTMIKEGCSIEELTGPYTSPEEAKDACDSLGGEWSTEKLGDQNQSGTRGYKIAYGLVYVGKGKCKPAFVRPVRVTEMDEGYSVEWYRWCGCNNTTPGA